MKNTFLALILFLYSSFSAQAQEPTALSINWDKKAIFLNEIKQDKLTGIKELQTALGSPSRILSEDTLNTKLYVYDSLGLSVVIDTLTGHLNNIYIHFSKGRGGDFKTSPAKLYSGNLSIENHPLSATEKIESIKEKTNLPFEEWFPGAYFFMAANEEFTITITYRDKKKEVITQCLINFVEEKERITH
jgi:hypothetical protein